MRYNRGYPRHSISSRRQEGEPKSRSYSSDNGENKQKWIKKGAKARLEHVRIESQGLS